MANFPPGWINSVLQGDCLELMTQLPDRQIDMILCDLPYGTTRHQWDTVINLTALWAQYERIIKDHGAIVLTAQGGFTGQLICSNPQLFRYKLVWIKSKATNFLNRAIQPLRAHEDVCVFYRNQPVYHPQMRPGRPYNKGVRKANVADTYGAYGSAAIRSDGPRYPLDVVYHPAVEDVIHLSTASHAEDTFYHSTQKPVDLGRYLIRTFTDPGQLVLDNTCGSGSFVVAAAMENRRYIGMEMNNNVTHNGKPVDLIAICRRRLSSVQLSLML